MFSCLNAKYVAHNRYWGSAVEYAKQNHGKYDFIVEGIKAIPTSQQFWNDLMNESKAWGMATYEQVRTSRLCFAQPLQAQHASTAVRHRARACV